MEYNRRTQLRKKSERRELMQLVEPENLYYDQRIWGSLLTFVITWIVCNKECIKRLFNNGFNC